VRLTATAFTAETRRTQRTTYQGNGKIRNRRSFGRLRTASYVERWTPMNADAEETARSMLSVHFANRYS